MALPFKAEDNFSVYHNIILSRIFQIVFQQRVVTNLDIKSTTAAVAGEKHAACGTRSAPRSVSLPPWTIIGHEVPRTGAAQPTQEQCTWQPGRGKDDMYASCYS